MSSVKAYPLNPIHPPLQKPRSDGCCVIGTEVESLFPSLADLESAKMVRLAVKKSNMDFQNVDYKLALRYLRIVCGVDYLKEVGLGHVSPTWRGKRQDLVTVGGEQSRLDGNWKDVARELLQWEQKGVLSRTVEVAVIAAMGTHAYSFTDKVYVQQSVK